MNNSCNEKFSYERISTTSNGPRIRLIELFPGSSDQIIECKMILSFLEEPWAYEALSYTWSSSGKIWIPNSPTPIICDNKHLDIPKSLETALCHLRNPQESRIIWADAICINQQDDDEKTHQVRLMRDIYRRARMVIIWLGPESISGPGELALDLVPHLAAASKEPTPVVEQLHQSADIRQLMQLGSQVLKSHGMPHHGNTGYTVYRAFFDLLERPWFTRTWIVQEAVMASKAVLLCGTKSVPWIDFLDAFAYSIKQPSLMNILTPETLAYALGLLSACRAVQGGPGQRLLDLLLQHRQCGASDSRDKVFALCGLANDTGSNRLDVKPDYRRNKVEVYTDVAKSILLRSGDLDLLSVPRHSTASTVIDLPSWAPDWSLPQKQTSFSARDISGNRLFQFKATRDTKADPKFSVDDTLLSVKGMFIDQVISVGSLHETDTESMFLTKIPKEQIIINNWERVSGARSWAPYLNGEKMVDVFWQTLIGGCAPTEYNELRDQFLDINRTIKRFRMLHYMGLQNYRKTYLAASWVMLANSGMSDAFHMRFSSPLTGGYATRIFATRMAMAVTQRRIVKTRKGYVGLAAGDTAVDDSVALVQGGQVPLVLRKVDYHWQLVGDTYVHGIMNGEAFDENKCEMIWIV
ncbi:MAG: hypothetical protein L6R38_002584 [Xanthoria sp. 2 TBL-2021]|nr:MAG: hypothetical protein L6R38_002584 [Xanthoria sp. 2 TBL-2021]